MGFEWDPEKAAENLRTHGIAFEDAAQIFDGPTLEAADTREDYGEDRFRRSALCRGLNSPWSAPNEKMPSDSSPHGKQPNMSAKHTGKRSATKGKRASGSKKTATARKGAHKDALLHSMVERSGRGKARRTNWDTVRNLSDDDIRAGIAADPDAAPELDAAWFARAEVREPRPAKQAISFRVDPDVLEYFRSESPQYQSRMHEVLRAYVDHQRAKKAPSR